MFGYCCLVLHASAAGSCRSLLGLRHRQLSAAALERSSCLSKGGWRAHQTRTCPGNCKEQLHMMTLDLYQVNFAVRQGKQTFPSIIVQALCMSQLTTKSCKVLTWHGRPKWRVDRWLKH